MFGDALDSGGATWRAIPARWEVRLGGQGGSDLHRGVRTLDAMATAYEHKAAFDAVEDATPISVEQIAELLRNFAKVCNKPRLGAMPMVVASSLDGLGAKTVGAMRQVTSTMHVEDCGVRKLDAQLFRTSGDGGDAR